jgi:hydroxyacylglutathione hydrolase
VVGPRADEERIPGIDLALRDGQIWMFGEQEMQVLDTPGHTRGDILFFPWNLRQPSGMLMETVYGPET